MSDKFLRTLPIIGSIIQLGFGLWHFVVPPLYRWFDYMPSIPDELKNAITATNFFLSFCLVLLGIGALVVLIWRWNDTMAVSVTLGIMSALWVARVAYQVVKPQGPGVQGLAMGLLIVFTLIALCFLIPAIVLWRR